MAEPTVPPTADDPTIAPTEPVETPTEPTPAPPPEPVQHNPYLLRSANDLGISPEEVASYSPDELQQAVYHRTRALQAFRQQQPVVTANTPPVAPVTPKISLGISEQEEAELRELNPVLAKALRANAEAAARAERAASEQAESIRRQQSQGELARQVKDVMVTKHAKTLGVGTSAEPARMNAVLVELGRLANEGVITNSTPPEFAVAIAVKSLFDTGSPTPPPPAPRSVPTPTARPTARHGGGEEGDVNTIEDLQDYWAKKFREREVSESSQKDKNGSFRP